MELVWERIKIYTTFTLTSLREFHMQIKPNEHATMELRAYVDPAIAFEELKQEISETEIKVMVIDETGKEERLPLFAGIMETAEIYRVGGQYEMKLKAVSATRKLDEYRCSRSFQDVEKGYADIVNETLAFTPHAGALYYFDEDRPIGLPIIQYRETDWTFIKRLASHFALSVYAKTVSKNPVLFLGLPKTGVVAAFSTNAYEVAADQKFMEMGGDFSPYHRGHFLSFQVEDRENYQIGDEAKFQETDLVIIEKEAALIRGELRFRYLLGRKTLANQKMKYNDHFSGLSIGGTVIATARETVRLHLDIDGDREVPSYPYHWTPPSGNIMYLMPKVGTRASLYFCSQDERSAKATNSPRTDVSACAGMSDYSNRTLTTEHNKQMNLFPNIMSLVGIGNSASPLAATIKDATGIHFQSHGILDLIAAGAIRIEAPKVALTAPKQIIFQRTALIGPAKQISSRGTSGAQVDLQPVRLRSVALTLYQLQERIDGKGKFAYLFGTEYKTFPPHADVLDVGYNTKALIFQLAQGCGVLLTKVFAKFKIPELAAGTAASVTSLEIDITNNSDINKTLENAFRSFVVGFAIGATARKKGEAARLGSGVGFAMAGGDLPEEMVEWLMDAAKLLEETTGLNNLPNNGYYTTSVKGMTLTVDHYGNVYAGISNSLDFTYGKDLPVSWTQGYVTIDGMEDSEIKEDNMKNALGGGGLTTTLHAGETQVTAGVCLFPEDDDKTGGLSRGYTHEVGLDRQVGISFGVGAAEHIGNVNGQIDKEEGLFYGR